MEAFRIVDELCRRIQRDVVRYNAVFMDWLFEEINWRMDLLEQQGIDPTLIEVAPNVLEFLRETIQVPIPAFFGTPIVANPHLGRCGIKVS